MVDEAALEKAITSKHLGGAGRDVMVDDRALDRTSHWGRVFAFSPFTVWFNSPASR